MLPAAPFRRSLHLVCDLIVKSCARPESKTYDSTYGIRGKTINALQSPRALQLAREPLCLDEVTRNELEISHIHADSRPCTRECNPHAYTGRRLLGIQFGASAVDVERTPAWLRQTLNPALGFELYAKGNMR